MPAFRFPSLSGSRPIQVNDGHLTLNEPHFRKMACGDLGGFIELAWEFFEDTRSRVAQWADLLLRHETAPLLDEFHRCKGGAALFGFERLVRLLDCWELQDLEAGPLDLDCFLGEVKAAEAAVALLAR